MSSGGQWSPSLRKTASSVVTPPPICTARGPPHTAELNWSEQRAVWSWCRTSPHNVQCGWTGGHLLSTRSSFPQQPSYGYCHLASSTRHCVIGAVWVPQLWPVSPLVLRNWTRLDWTQISAIKARKLDWLKNCVFFPFFFFFFSMNPNSSCM